MKVVDMHCDTISELFDRKREGKVCSVRRNGGHLDLERMKKGDYCLQNFALYTCMDKVDNPFEYCMKLADLFYEEMEACVDLIGVVRSYDEIESNRRVGRMSALLTIEEGGVCLGEIAFLRNFYRLGVRMMTLTWNFPNELASPNRAGVREGRAFFEPETEQGLTETGLEFVREMERLGMILDVSHLSDRGIFDALELTHMPIVASHSNARAVASNPRNLTDEMIRRISERGGVAGINYCAAFLHDWQAGEREISRVEDMILHMKHMKEVGGIQCIGLGSDFDGIGGELELKSPDMLPVLEGAMHRAGFTDGEIEAVFFGNVLRVYKEVLS